MGGSLLLPQNQKKNNIVNTATSPANDRMKSLSGTVLLHVAILSLLFLVKCGGGGGGNGGLGYTGLMSMDVAGLGNPVDGWGDPQPEASETVKPVEETPIEDNSAISDDASENVAPVVNPSKNDKPITKPKDPNTKPKTPVTEQQKLDAKLNGLLNNIGKGQGNTSGGGQQGSSDGQIDGKGVLNGGGSQGTGGGQGGGNGTGNGPGNGPGSGSGSGGGMSVFELGVRSMTGEPTLSEIAPDEGKVVVDITVNSNGKVISAKANPGLSTTTNSKLYSLAEKSAYKAKFNSSTSPLQKGTITINFVLN